MKATISARSPPLPTVMASPPNSLRVLEHALVSPPAGVVSPVSLPLTLFDISWLYTGPVERLFYYSSAHPTAHFAALKNSLSLALRRFHPLAGRVRPSPGSTTSFEIYSGEGDSVPLTLAESDDDFHQISGDRARESSRLNPLVPRLPRSDDGSVPLLALQVTVFPGRGLCLGVAIHHVACDDSSSMHFLKSWAAACRLGESDPEPLAEPPPFYDRTVIADPGGLYLKIINEMQRFKPDPSVGSSPPPAPPPDLVFASVSLGQDLLKRLKLRVLALAGDGKAPFHCSTFVVACAYAWTCLIRAAATVGKSAHLLFSVDCRGRLRPPVPEGYFGNCLRPCFVEVDAGVLGGEGGLAAAAEAIGRAIEGLGEGVLDGAEGWLQRIISLLPERPMSVAGSPKFRVYDVDFGWGRPQKVEMVSIEKTPGTISLAESRDEPGGIEIGLVLPKGEMDEFECSFSDGLKFV